MVAMHGVFRYVPACLALALLAAPVAGMCAPLVAPDDPCEMRETREAASCGHGEMVMSGCCSVESVEPPAEAIMPDAASDVEPPPAVPGGLEAFASRGSEAAATACDGDPPPAVPRYRLFSALLL